MADLVADLGPWALVENRVERFYRGGALLERFRNNAGDAADGNRPEDWLGSATRSWSPPGIARTDEGLSRAVTRDGDRRIVDLLADDPAGIAGADLVAAAGVTTGLLVKLLDAAIRLPVHAHPTRDFARRNLASYFGKTEAWIVLATREVPGEPAPSVRIGFRRDVGREALRRIIDEERSDELLAAMHVRQTGPGDVWLVPAGTPHAIGAGIFLVELQEPSDFSIVAETRGFPIDRENAHLGLGWDVMIDAFDAADHPETWIDGLRATLPKAAPGRAPVSLLPEAAAPFFRAFRVDARGRIRPGFEPAFLVGVVVEGRGVVRTPSGSLDVRRGSTFAVPARGVPELELESSDGLGIIACLPPRAADLEGG
ncbi:MAG TPA: class I mannose-6-phosphate isomerase [Candidatus Limnocylindrales bacterium]